MAAFAAPTSAAVAARDGSTGWLTQRVVLVSLPWEIPARGGLAPGSWAGAAVGAVAAAAAAYASANARRARGHGKALGLRPASALGGVLRRAAEGEAKGKEAAEKSEGTADKGGEDSEASNKEASEEPKETADKDGEIVIRKDDAGALAQPLPPRRAPESVAKPAYEPSEQVGAMAPLGYFDPLGFCPKGDEAKFRSLRSQELKHGRVAMMATVGAVVQHYVKFPVFVAAKSSAGIFAIFKEPVSWAFWALLVPLCGVLELRVWKDDRREPGNFGDPFGLGMYDEGMRNREINNGRFAMFAAAGIIAGELYTGLDGVDQLKQIGLPF